MQDLKKERHLTMFSPLATKFFPQKAHTNSVKRSRLIDKLNESLELELTTIIAAAGYGKSSLVAEWLSSYKEDANANFQFIWLSLDKEDNDWVQFWQYVITALWQVDEEVGLTAIQALELREEESFNLILNSLIGDLDTNYIHSNMQLILVLDDYHCIDNQLIHEQLSGFIKKVPSKVMHLVVISRQEPPLGLGRRRAEQQLCELRTKDLRFSHQECIELFKNSIPDISISIIESLNERAEGWVTGLQLLALSLKDETSYEVFIEEFTGKHKFIADYLLEEVFKQQSDEIQLFLMETAFLDRFNSSLCEIIRSQSTVASSALIVMIEEKNLFLLSLDKQRQWFRYHHLFSEFLQNRYLQNKDTQSKKEILLKASQWSAKQGLFQAAINYAFDAQQNRLAAKFITEYAEQNSNWANIRALWLSKVEDYFDEYPLLFFIECNVIYYFSSTEVTMPERKISINILVDKAIKNPFVTSDERLHAYYFIYRSLALPDSEMASVVNKHITALKNVLGRLDLKEFKIRSELCSIIARSFFLIHKFEEGINYSQLAMIEAEKANDTIQAINSLVLYCKCEMSLGNISKAFEVANNFLLQTSETSKNNPKVGAVYHIVGHTKLAMADYYSALIILKQAQRLAEFSDTVATVNILCDLFYVYWVLGDIENAQTVLNKLNKQTKFAEHLKEQFYYKLKLESYQLNKSELDLCQQNLHKRLNRKESDLEWHYRVFLEVNCYICMKQFQTGMLLSLKEPIKLINSFLARSDEKHFIFIVRNLLLLTHLYLIEGQTELAYNTFKKSITMCSNEKGFNTTFFKYVEIYEPLVEQCLTDNINIEYCHKLLRLYKDFKSLKAGFSQPVSTNSNEILSRREIDVLKLISTGLSNKAIAKNLELSPNTVRAHASNIYSKLAVKNRTEAVAKAIEVGML